MTAQFKHGDCVRLTRDAHTCFGVVPTGRAGWFQSEHGGHATVFVQTDPTKPGLLNVVRVPVAFVVPLFPRKEAP